MRTVALSLLLAWGVLLTGVIYSSVDLISGVLR